MSQFIFRHIIALILSVIFTILLGSSISPAQCAPAPDGMISWWTGDDEALDGKGTNNGDLVNGTTFGTGKVGRAFVFDGVNDLVEIPDTAGLDISGAMTISFWAKLNTVDAWRGFISKSFYSGGYQDTAFTLKLTPAGRLNFLATSNGGESGLMWPESNSVVTAGAWHHYTVVYSPGSYVRFYIDGNLDADRTSGIVPAIYNSTQPVRIGTDNGSTINGSMDEVMIFNRALSITEVQSVYIADTAGVCATCIAVQTGLISTFSAENTPLDDNLLNNAALRNGAAYTDGKSGRAFDLSGSAYVQVASPENLPVGSAPRTIEMWIKTPVDLTSSTESGIFQYGSPSTGNMFGLITSSNAPGRLYLYGHSADLSGTTLLRPNLWYHVAATYDGVVARLYVNGKLDNQGSLGLNTMLTGDGLTIGYRVGGATWNGQIDEPSIYNRELSAMEIQTIVSAGKAGRCTTCASVPVGLISGYDADTSAFDARSRNDGSLQNGASYAAGKSGEAFSFNGSNQFVEIPDNPSLRPSGGLTLSGWFKFNAANASGALISKPFATGSQNSYVIWAQGGVLYASFGGGVVSKPFSSVANRWYQLAYTYNDADFSHRLYIDGELVSTTFAAVSPTYQSTAVLIGIDKDNGTPVLALNGLADEIGIYGRALSLAEIRSLVVADKSGTCGPTAVSSPSGLAAWWPGDGDARDISGNGLNGTLLSGGEFGLGNVGQSFEFNGTLNSGVTIPHWPTLNVNPTGFTTEFWMKSNAPHAGLASLVDKSHGFADPTGWAFSVGGGVARFAMGDQSIHSVPEVISSSVVDDGSYHHIAGTWNGTSIAIYVDGVFQSSLILPLPFNNTRPLLLGYAWGGGTPERFFNGNIDEVSIYERALTPNEIASIYRAGFAGKLKSVSTPAGVASRSSKRSASMAPSVVSVNVGDATISFPAVSTPGITQQVPLTAIGLPPMPGGYISGRLFYDLATSAEYSGQPTVCFNIPSLAAQFSGYRILHLENGNWIDRTDLMSVSPALCSTGLPSLSPFAVAKLIPTAAEVSVSGRVLGAHGAIPAALVTLTDPEGNVRNARTNTFGFYRFDAVAVGSTYVVEVTAKRYRFAVPTRVVYVGDELTGVDFEAFE